MLEAAASQVAQVRPGLYGLALGQLKLPYTSLPVGCAAQVFDKFHFEKNKFFCFQKIF